MEVTIFLFLTAKVLQEKKFQHSKLSHDCNKNHKSGLRGMVITSKLRNP